jgi:hypothetical protein
MSLVVPTIRPSLEEATDDWKKILAGYGYPTDILWIFEENLCVEHQLAETGGYHFGFQTKFTPVPEDAADIAYDYFSELPERIVFYRLGTCPGHSVCMLLCDSWFDRKTEADGFVRHDETNLSFYPGHHDHIEEVTDLSRWVRRVKRPRAFSDLDFCLSLSLIDEIRDYGRPLAPYERFAGRMLQRLRQVLRQE